jgi:hypothetical protein
MVYLGYMGGTRDNSSSTSSLVYLRRQKTVQKSGMLFKIVLVVFSSFPPFLWFEKAAQTSK